MAKILHHYRYAHCVHKCVSVSNRYIFNDAMLVSQCVVLFIQVFVLHDDLPRGCSMNAWQRLAGIIFLQSPSSAAIARLYDALNCHAISVTRLYLDFVFVNFDYLSVTGRLAYLEFLRDVFLAQTSADDRALIVAALRQLHFVPDSGTHRVAVTIIMT